MNCLLSRCKILLHICHRATGQKFVNIRQSRVWHQRTKTKSWILRRISNATTLINMSSETAELLTAEWSCSRQHPLIPLSPELVPMSTRVLLVYRRWRLLHHMESHTMEWVVRNKKTLNHQRASFKQYSVSLLFVSKPACPTRWKIF